MSLTAAALRLMAEKGLSAHDIAEIAEAMESRRDPTAAERQQRRRDKVKAERDASRVTSRCDAPPNDIYLTPPDLPQSTDVDCPPAQKSEIENSVQAWNAMAQRVGLPAVRGRLTGSRLSMLKARIAEHGPDAIGEAIAAIERSPFCRGETKQDWRADFKFMVRPDNFAKLLEGGYDPPNRMHPPPSQQSDLHALMRGAQKYAGLEPLRSFS